MGLRANPRRFAVFAEHAIPEAEDVVATRGGWAISRRPPGPRPTSPPPTHYAVRRRRALAGLGDIARFYAEEYVEDVRLTRSPHGRLEFARTGRVAGAGAPGAAGARARRGRRDRHPRALAGRGGYDVTLST